MGETYWLHPTARYAFLLLSAMGIKLEAVLPSGSRVHIVGLPTPGRISEASPLRSASIGLMERDHKPGKSAAARMEAMRVQRLKEDAQRPLSVNLAEGIALSHKMLRFTGAALKH